MTESLESRLDRARWRLLQEPQTVFYGTLSLRLRDSVSESIPTAATNGREIIWNRPWAESLSDAELRFVLAHETLHCGHQHMWRLPLTPRGNQAGDYAINAILRGIPGMTMPTGGLYNPQYADLAEEEIYARLPESESYQDACGGVSASSADAPDCAPDSPLRAQWRDAVLQAAVAARAARGDIPGDMQREIARATARRVDWRAATAEFIRSATSQRNDWSRSSRRGAGRDYVLPRRRHDRVGAIVIVRDTSGSVSDTLLAQFNALAESALAECGTDVVVIDADVSVQAEYRIAAGEPLPATAHGGGGTDFRAAFARATELARAEPIAGLIYLTDLDGAFPADCEIPTLWVSVGNGAATAPFGRTISIGE